MGMTEDEYEAFRASACAEGAKIDPQNCEVLRTHVKDLDPYNVLDLPPELEQVGSHWFIRALPDGKWISEDDLPKDVLEAVCARKLRSVAWPQMQPRAGMTVADVEAFHAERKAEAQRIDTTNCVVAGWYVQILDPYGVFDVPEEGDCIGHNWFVRNLPDGDWVWSGDLPEGTRRALEGREEKEDIPFPF